MTTLLRFRNATQAPMSVSQPYELAKYPQNYLGLMLLELLLRLLKKSHFSVLKSFRGNQFLKLTLKKSFKISYKKRKS